MAQNHASDPERIRQMLQALRASLGQAEEQEASVPDHEPIAVLNTEKQEERAPWEDAPEERSEAPAASELDPEEEELPEEELEVIEASEEESAEEEELPEEEALEEIETVEEEELPEEELEVIEASEEESTEEELPEEEVLEEIETVEEELPEEELEVIESSEEEGAEEEELPEEEAFEEIEIVEEELPEEEAADAPELQEAEILKPASAIESESARGDSLFVSAGGLAHSEGESDGEGEFYNFYAPATEDIAEEDGEELTPVSVVRKASLEEEDTLVLESTSKTEMDEETANFFYSRYHIRPAHSDAVDRSEKEAVAEEEREVASGDVGQKSEQAEEPAVKATEDVSTAAPKRPYVSPSAKPAVLQTDTGVYELQKKADPVPSEAEGHSASPFSEEQALSDEEAADAIPELDPATAQLLLALEEEQRSGEDISLTTDIIARKTLRIPKGEPVEQKDNVPTYEMDEPTPPASSRKAPVGAEKPLEEPKATDEIEIDDPEPKAEAEERQDAEAEKKESENPQIRISNLEAGGSTGRLKLKEYTDKSETEIIRTNFRWELGFRYAGIIVLAVLSVGLLFLENVGALFGIELPFYFSGSELPAVSILINLLCLLVAVGVTVPDFIWGFRRLKMKKVTAEFAAVLPPLTALVYDVVLLIQNNVSPIFCSAPAVFFLLMLQVSELIRLKTSYEAFSFCASPGEKLVLCPMSPDAVKDERRSLQFPLDSHIVRMRKTIFVEGSMRRTARSEGDMLQQLAILIVSVLVAVGMGVLAILFNPNKVALYVTLGVTMASGTCLLFSRAWSVYRAVRVAAAKDCYVAGERSVMEYASVDAMCFEDIMAFPTGGTKFVRIRLFRGPGLEYFLGKMTVLFAEVGGPLRGAFADATKAYQTGEPCRLMQVEPDGVCARVGDSVIRVGSGAYMQRHRIMPPYDAEDEKLLAQGCVLMFVAENERCCGRFYFSYRSFPGFEKTVDVLRRNGVRVAIRTFDPNISDALIRKNSVLSDADVRVVHRLITTHGDYTAPKVNSGLGTADSADDLPRLILLCKRARRAIFAQSILSVLGCFGGVALALTLGVFGVANLPCSLVAVGLQAAIVLVQTLFGKLYLHSVPEIK